MATMARAPLAHDGAALEEQIDLEKLGRQRPAVFSSTLSEMLFCFSLLTTSMMAVCVFGTFLPSLAPPRRI